jgi:hypothetical protein
MLHGSGLSTPCLITSAWRNFLVGCYSEAIQKLCRAIFATSAPEIPFALQLHRTTVWCGATAQPSRERMITSGDVARVQQEIARVQQRFGLPEDARVVSGYDAGRAGFRLNRYLVAPSVQNHVIDSARIEVNRCQRRAKTDAVRPADAPQARVAAGALSHHVHSDAGGRGRALVRRREDPVIDPVRQLFTLRGIGVHSACCVSWHILPGWISRRPSRWAQWLA